MILRVIHAAVPPEKRKSWIDFVNTTLGPAIKSKPGCRFFHIAECIEKCHEHEVIFISGWDSEEQCEVIDSTSAYQGLAESAKTFYTHRFHDGAIHVHYKTIANLE